MPALAAAEAAIGADVRLWTGLSPADSKFVTEFADVQFCNGPFEQLLLNGWRPDVIHDHGLWLSSNRAVARLSRRLRICRLVSPRGMLAPWCMRHHRFRKQLAWKLYQYRDLVSASALHATSPSEAEHFRQLGLSCRVLCVPNGVELPDAGSARSNCKQPGQREILFLSRLHPVKGLLNLIEAWTRCRRPGWRLRIVGDSYAGHREVIIRRLESDREARSTVLVQDAVHSEEKWQLLRNADVLILPSFSENFGVVCAEALAVGTPVITTTGTPWNQLGAQRCGWYVDPTPENIAAAIREAMDLPQEDLSAMGRRGQKWVRKEFSWQDIGRRMLQAYSEVASEFKRVEQPRRRKAA
ncbi:MAG: glycosyltransferase [Planctomycetaceae bacterium]|nr:glycosyltransferase [Planctomycetaceae bacterium]